MQARGDSQKQAWRVRLRRVAAIVWRGVAGGKGGPRAPRVLSCVGPPIHGHSRPRLSCTAPYGPSPALACSDVPVPPSRRRTTTALMLLAQALRRAGSHCVPCPSPRGPSPAARTSSPLRLGRWVRQRLRIGSHRTPYRKSRPPHMAACQTPSCVGCYCLPLMPPLPPMPRRACCWASCTTWRCRTRGCACVAVTPERRG